jgi:hypothetical protein
MENPMVVADFDVWATRPPGLWWFGQMWAACPEVNPLEVN